jgi:hypothetical protein
MPVGTTNGDHKCADCKKRIPHGTDAYLDIDTLKVYCLVCRDENGRRKAPVHGTADAPSVPHPKTVVVRHESSKVDDLKKENATLKAENKQLKKDLAKLRKHSKELLGILDKMRKSGKQAKASFEDELIRVRRTGPNNRCD